MLYSKLAAVYEKLGGTTKKLEKRDILAGLYKGCSSSEIYRVVLLSMGVVGVGLELGLAREMMLRVIAKSYGVGKSDIVRKFRSTGDLGLTAEYFSKHRKQITLSRKKLHVKDVFENLQKLPTVTGSGSQDRKVRLVSELLSHSSPLEARYVVRTVLGDMRIGVAAGIVRDAIAKAFSREPVEVEKVYDVLGDFGRVAELVKKGELKADVAVGRPVRVMLGERVPDMKTALDKFENVALELKYDGFRMAVHKQGKHVWLFSRRLDDVTRQFPEIVEFARKLIKAKSAIVEGEVLAIGADGKPKSFQTLSRRIKRKYEIEKMVSEIPVQINFFDLIYANGKSFMDEPLKERWKMLNRVIRKKKGKFQLAEHIETHSLREAEKFYQYALSLGQEGLMVKNLDARYQPGRRVGYWLKVKPIMEPLDLVIVGASWGEGKRAKWLGSLLLACRSGEKFVPTGMMGSGLTDKQLGEITRKLKRLIIEEHGRTVEVKPRIVVEVAYEEIQRSPKYPTGYALRFPRLLRFREGEKKPEDVNTKADIEKLFKQQKRFK